MSDLPIKMDPVRQAQLEILAGRRTVAQLLDVWIREHWEEADRLYTLPGFMVEQSDGDMYAVVIPGLGELRLLRDELKALQDAINEWPDPDQTVAMQSVRLERPGGVGKLSVRFHAATIDIFYKETLSADSTVATMQVSVVFDLANMIANALDANE